MQVPPFSLDQQLSEIGHELDAAVLRVLRSGHYIGGDEVQAFEKSFAASVGVSCSVACNSGTDALILALRALDIGSGDEVITSSFSFFATAEAISAVGATPVFVEVNPRNYLIEIGEIESAITAATKAILPVHLFGCPVDMDKLMSLAKKNGLKVIEDCAQASGARWKGRHVGSWGDVGCFSFFPTKNLGCAGDGGAVTTNDACLAQRIRELAVHGMPRRYVHNELGYNSRLDAVQAAILNVKLPKLSGWIQCRKAIADNYQKFLKEIPGLELPLNSTENNIEHGWNQFVVRVVSSPIKNSFDESISDSSLSVFPNTSLQGVARDWLKESLQNEGINTIIYYPIPIHLQPAYKELGYGPGSFPITEKLCKEVLSLPIFPELTSDQQKYVSAIIRKLFCISNKSEFSLIA